VGTNQHTLLLIRATPLSTFSILFLMVTCNLYLYYYYYYYGNFSC